MDVSATNICTGCSFVIDRRNGEGLAVHQSNQKTFSIDSRQGTIRLIVSIRLKSNQADVVTGLVERCLNSIHDDINTHRCFLRKVPTIRESDCDDSGFDEEKSYDEEHECPYMKLMNCQRNE
jgi:hypothetical protein